MVSVIRSKLLLAWFVLALPVALVGQTAADSAAIRGAALDYIEGWYEGDAERMARAVHPDLVKRIVLRFPDGEDALSETTAKKLVEQVERGGGTTTPESRRRGDVEILDIFRTVASVRVDAAEWIDYMHLARVDDRWVILNVLWEKRPRP